MRIIKMKIVFDCFKLIKGVGKSIGIYNVALNLSRQLIEYKKSCNNVSIENAELIILGNKYNKDDFNIDGVRFIEITNYNPLNKLHCLYWELFAVSSVVKKLGADRVLFPRGFSALTHPVKDFIIIHDLIPFFYNENYPGVFNRFENAYIMKRLQASAETCNNIITISQSSKNDILKYCRIDEEKIKVIPNGCNKIEIEDTEDYAQKPYICAITSTLPHKNAKGIFESYKRYCEISDNPLNMTVIGVDDSYKNHLPEDIKEKIICYKYIKENKELHALIRNSSLFLFLSLAEGFGFPPVEAMQLKVPVICSDRSSLPEVVGDAALLVNPENYDEVANAIKDLLANENLKDALIEKGAKNIIRFDWSNIAKQYWESLLS